MVGVFPDSLRIAHLSTFNNRPLAQRSFAFHLRLPNGTGTALEPLAAVRCETCANRSDITVVGLAISELRQIITMLKGIIDSFVWFFGGLLGIDSILSRPEHDVTGRRATVEDFRSH